MRENPLSGYVDGYLTHISKFLLRVLHIPFAFLKCAQLMRANMCNISIYIHILHMKYPVGAGKGSARVLSVCAALPPVLPGPHAPDDSLCSSRIASRPIRGALHGLRAARHRTPRFVVVVVRSTLRTTRSLGQCSPPPPSSQAPASVRRAKRSPTWLRSSRVRLTHTRALCLRSHTHLFSNCVRAEDLVENLCKALVLFYLVPTPEDLSEWENEPENYFNEELRCALGLPS